MPSPGAVWSDEARPALLPDAPHIPRFEVDHGVELEDVNGPLDKNVGDTKNNTQDDVPASLRRHSAFLGLANGETLKHQSWRPREVNRKGARRWLDHIDNPIFFSTPLNGWIDFIPDPKKEGH